MYFCEGNFRTASFYCNPLHKMCLCHHKMCVYYNKISVWEGKGAWAGAVFTGLVLTMAVINFGQLALLNPMVIDDFFSVCWDVHFSISTLWNPCWPCDSSRSRSCLKVKKKNYCGMRTINWILKKFTGNNKNILHKYFYYWLKQYKCLV